MADSFNFNNFIGNFKRGAVYDPAKKHAAAEKNMEEQIVHKVEEAVKEKNFLYLTLSEKLENAGVGEYVMNQLADTAKNIVLDVVNPIRDYLEKNEHVFDGRIQDDIQSYAQRMFWDSQAMAKENKENPGQNFMWNM